MSAGRVVAAALLPPLGVYLHRGGGREFGIGTVLTLLAFVPGMIFALWTVLAQPALAEAPSEPAPASG